jgi:predicted Zn finger-like uncharacterized protein
MHTQCPHCQTVYRVTAAHLNIAQGHVRCSHCFNVFNATNYLVKEVSKETLASQPFEINEEKVAEISEFKIPDLLQEDIYNPQRRSWRFFLFWTLMTFLLAMLLGGQVIWFLQRDLILQHAQVRPWLDNFCFFMLCTLPPTRDLKSFYMREHFVQIHPDKKDVIQFEAIFINTAIFPQPYPDLQLIFQDINGHLIAKRRFQPAEYLSKRLRRREQMPAGASVHLKLEIKNIGQFVEEGKFVEGYRFEFL